VSLFLFTAKALSQQAKKSSSFQVLGGSIRVSITVKSPTCQKYIGEQGYLVSNGSIIAAANGGTPPYSYQLQNQTLPQNKGYFPGLYDRPYTLFITDSSGNTFDTTIVLTYTLPNPVVATQVNMLPSSCTSYNGSITLLGTGGTPPYNYSFDAGQTFTPNNTMNNLQQGYYIFYLKDANGCMSQSYTENAPDLYNYFFCYNCCNLMVGASPRTAPEGSACGNTGDLITWAYNGTPPYKYSFDSINFYYPNNVTNFSGSSDSDYNYSNLAPGLYHFYAKDRTGAIVAVTATLAQSCYIAISFIEVDASCHQNDGSLTVIVTKGTPPYSYTIDGINFQSSNVFTGLASGNYSVTAIDVNGEIYSTTTTLYNKCPIVTATEIDEICGDRAGAITAIGSKGTMPYKFSIDGTNFQSSNVFNNLLAGNYIVIIKDANGFTDSTFVTINNNCIELGISTTNCTCNNSNGSITVSVSNGTAPYSYSIDGIDFQSSNLFNNLAVGSYAVTVKDANGLSTVKDTTLTNVLPPQINTSLQQASCADTGGSLSILRSGGTAPFQYSINGGASLQSDSIFKGLDSAKYIAFVQDANGCTATDTVQLTALPTPAVSLGNDTVLCTGTSLQLNVPQIPGYAYTWQDNSNGYAYTVTSAGTYSVKVTNQFNCTASDTINIRYSPVPLFTLGDDTVLCNGQTLLLQPIFSNGFSYTYKYLWSDGSTVSPNLKISVPGQYWLQVSLNGCAGSDSIMVAYKSSPALNFGNDTTLCNGETLLLNATNNNASYLWQDGSTSPTYNVINAGTYSVKVDENGCDTSGRITVTYISKPIINLISDTTLCITQQLVLDASYPNSTYEWQDGSTSPQYAVSTEGKYIVQVMNNCGVTIDSSLVAYENCACKFYVPSAFTPNNDGKNDVFMPKYQCLFSNYEMKVYNRYGQLVFVSSNPSNGWDGSFNSNRQPSGTYVWELSYIDNLTGKHMRKNGTVVLIR
jgi:gliding motility-associated-like protein